MTLGQMIASRAHYGYDSLEHPAKESFLSKPIKQEE
jgi:hypothetical protein